MYLEWWVKEIISGWGALPCSYNWPFLSGMQFFSQQYKPTAESGSGFIFLCSGFLHLLLSSEGCLGCSAPWSPLPQAWHRRLPPTTALIGILHFLSRPLFSECLFLGDIFLPFECTCIPYLLCKFFTYLCFYSHWTIAFPRENKPLSLWQCWGPTVSQCKASTKPHPFTFIAFSWICPPLIYLLSKAENDFSLGWHERVLDTFFLRYALSSSDNTIRWPS